MEEFTTHNAPILTPYVPLFAGTLARSLACISCSPIELARTRMQVTSYNFFGCFTILDLMRYENKEDIISLYLFVMDYMHFILPFSFYIHKV